MSKWTPRSRLYWKLREQVKREEPYCWICNLPIDRKLKWPDPWMFTVDHVKAVSIWPELGEDRENMRAAHLRCNKARGTGTKPARARDGQIYYDGIDL